MGEPRLRGEAGGVLPHRQAGAHGSQGGLVIGAAFAGFGEGDEFFHFRVRQPAIDVQQGVVQVVADLLHQALALAVEHALGLAAAQQTGEHLAQAVGGDAGQGEADFGTRLPRRQGLGQVAHLQLAGGAGFHARQAVGVLGELVTAGGQDLGGGDLAPQRRLEEGQGRAWIAQVGSQCGEGALVHGLALEAAVAVVHQRLVDGRRQALLVTLLRGAQRISEMRPLFRPARRLVKAGVVVGQRRQTE